MSLVGFKAQNHKQQTGKRGARISVDERGTDPALFGMLHRRFRFTLDVAANSDNAKCQNYFNANADEDGLIQKWHGRVWCNPPYSDLHSWVAKAWKAHFAGCPLIVMLVPANRTEQKWWQELIEPSRDRGDGFRVEFLPGRPRFTAPGQHSAPPNSRPPFGCCLLIWIGSASEYVTPAPPYERQSECGLTYERQGNHVIVGEPRPLRAPLTQENP